MFAPISRQEAELIQQQAPPSYGQLIAQGIIPPVEDFPTENPNEVRDGCVLLSEKRRNRSISNPFPLGSALKLKFNRTAFLPYC